MLRPMCRQVSAPPYRQIGQLDRKKPARFQGRSAFLLDVLHYLLHTAVKERAQAVNGIGGDAFTGFDGIVCRPVKSHFLELI